MTLFEAKSFDGDCTIDIHSDPLRNSRRAHRKKTCNDCEVTVSKPQSIFNQKKGSAAQPFPAFFELVEVNTLKGGKLKTTPPVQNLSGKGYGRAKFGSFQGFHPGKWQCDDNHAGGCTKRGKDSHRGTPSVTTSKCAENTKKMMKTVAPLQKAVLFTAFMKRPFGPIFNPLVSAASSVSPTPVNSCKFLSQLDVFPLLHSGNQTWQ